MATDPGAHDEARQASDTRWMLRACQLADNGRGHVEPNPMVGCVLVRDDQLLAEGYHSRFGGPHAERVALANLGEGQSAAGATAYVSLEPCCHFGKTPPCTDALIEAGVTRVCCALLDPFPQVAGQGVARLRQSGIEVDVGCGQAWSRQLLAPYLKRVMHGLPFVIAKWAMSLDGKIATREGDSRWISSPASRQHAHRVRGQVDAIVVGSRTAAVDDPLLTARPAGPRVAVRVVVDSAANLSPTSQLVQSAATIPLLIWSTQAAKADNVSRLREHGCIVHCSHANDRGLVDLLKFLATEYQATNVLVEGGGELLGHLFDAKVIDEVQVYIAPKLIGGSGASAPLAAIGLTHVAHSPSLDICERAMLDEDWFIRARVHYK